MGEGTEPIEDDEELYRRIPVSMNWYDPELDAPPSPKAFRPREPEIGGLSVSRAKYKTPQEVAHNDHGRQYYVAVLRAGDLRDRGLEVAPRPISPDDPGHAELPDLCASNRRDTEDLQLMLAEKLCLRVIGPFPAQPAQGGLGRLHTNTDGDTQP